MSYSNEEVEKLKRYLSEIVDERFFSSLHELKKKFAVAISKEEQNATKLADYERELEVFRKCHECHRLNVDTREFGCQVTEKELVEATSKPSNKQHDITEAHRNKEPRLETRADVSDRSTSAVQLVEKHKESRQTKSPREPTRMVVDQVHPSSERPTDSNSLEPEIIEISSSDEL